MKRSRTLVLVPLALLLVAAATEPTAEELVRKGNAAFARQEYDAAVQLYTRAEATIANPGLVAFNKAAALYRLGRFRDAELHYQRCLEEAEGSQRLAIVYNLGNCLLQQAQAGGDLDLFRQAVACYQECMRDEAGDANLREQARYNLELTKLLWQQARITRAAQPGKEEGSDPKPEQPKPEKKTEEPKGDQAQPGAEPASKSGVPQQAKMDDKNGKQQAIETEKLAPGKGNVQPPADNDKLKPLAPEDALRNLEAAAERIRRERSAYMQRASPVPSREVPDW